MIGEKYIIVQTSYGGEEAIIFGELLTHKEVAGNLDVISAGFCQLADGGFTYSVWGSSVTLGIGSRKEDSEILNRLFSEDYF